MSKSIFLRHERGV
jgi:hypothetical protein